MASEYKPFVPSTEHNPLRPYYRPPSIGGAANDTGIPSASPAHGGRNAFGTSARDMLSDVKFDEILDAGNAGSLSIRALLDQAVWKYTSVFLAQPFEVAKMVLQCHVHRVQLEKRPGLYSAGSSRRDSRPHQIYLSDEEASDDEPSYFTSNAPTTPSLNRKASSRHQQRSLSPSTPLSPRTPSHRTPRASTSAASTRDNPPQPAYKLSLQKPASLTEVLSQLYAREGAWGVWKGTNVTFVYSILLRAIESWSRSMLAALLNLPDPGLIPGTSGSVGGLDILDSPSPLLSLGIAVAATGIAGLLLAPLDIVRTRIILTPTSHPPRTLLATLRSLPSYTLPPHLLAPTLLHATIPTFVSTAAPLFLRSNFAIDPLITPTAYSLATFATSTLELFAKLPVETVLRRGQIDVFRPLAPGQKKARRRASAKSGSLSSSSETEAASAAALPLVVDVLPYKGLLGTAWRIVREDGTSLRVARVPATDLQANRAGTSQEVDKGQGISGLVRGWRVGWWGLVGVWGAAALGGGGKGGEF